MSSEKIPHSIDASERFFGDRIGSILEKMDKNSSIIDIGSGSGRIALRYADLGFKQIEAVDIKDCLDEDVRHVVNFRKCNLSYDRLPYPDSTVDIATSFQVLEHVENPWHMIREISRVLTPDGALLISFASSKDIFSRFLFLGKGDVRHFTPFNNHISFFPGAVEKKLFKDFSITGKHCLPLRMPGTRFLGRKLGFSVFLPRLEIFSSKILYIMSKSVFPGKVEQQ